MGKRIIIKGADFSANGMKEQWVEKTTTTEQGFVNLQMSTASENSGKLGQTINAWAFNRIVHSNTEIILHAGDSIAIMEKQGSSPGVTIGAIQLNGTYQSLYPSLICSSSGAIKIGTVIATTNYKSNTALPIFLTNTSNEDWTIIMTAGSFSTSAPSASNKLVASYLKGKEQADSNVPTIAYRIYTDHPENYGEDSSKENNLEFEDEGGNNSGDNWDDESDT